MASIHQQYYNKFANLKKEPKIHDKEAVDLVGISLWDHQTFQEVFKNSGPNAVKNEFQFHYWSLNLRKKFKDNSILDISIPTVLFNYSQTVSGAHIDFELKDVDEVSDALLDFHNSEVSVLLDKMKQAGFDTSDFELSSVNLNSVHRHPGGRSQSFSSTDLATNHDKETGVVFPLSEAKDKPNFASIMSIVNNKCYLAHSEYRLADGSVTDKDGITYWNGRTAAYVRNSNPFENISEVEAFLDTAKPEESYAIYDDLTASDTIKHFYSLWDKVDYLPSTDMVNPDNVKEKVYASRSYTSSYNSKTPSSTKKNNKDEKYMSDDKELAASFIKATKIPIFSSKEITKLSKKKKNEHCGLLESKYYNCKNIPVKNATFNDIIALQEDLLDEFQEDTNENEVAAYLSDDLDISNFYYHY